MSFFKNAAETAAQASPIEQALADLLAIDIAPHVARRDALMASIAAKEAAVKTTQARLQEVSDRIGWADGPDGDAVATAALLCGEVLPSPTTIWGTGGSSCQQASNP